MSVRKRRTDCHKHHSKIIAQVARKNCNVRKRAAVDRCSVKGRTAQIRPSDHQTLHTVWIPFLLASQWFICVLLVLESLPVARLVYNVKKKTILSQERRQMMALPL